MFLSRKTTASQCKADLEWMCMLCWILWLRNKIMIPLPGWRHISHCSRAACRRRMWQAALTYPCKNITRALLFCIVKRVYTHRMQTFRYLYVEISRAWKKISLSSCRLVCSWISKTKWLAFEGALQSATCFCRFMVPLMHFDKRSLQSPPHTHTHHSQMTPFPEDFFHLCTFWGLAQLYKCHKRFFLPLSYYTVASFLSFIPLLEKHYSKS